jgi:hypothetical protein
MQQLEYSKMANKRKAKKRKAQMFDQIFIYILMLIIFSSILLFGFVAIKKLLSQGEVIDASRFKTSLKNMVDSNIHYGTTQVEIVKIAGDYKEICFVDACVYLNGTDSCAYGPGEFDKLNMSEGSTGLDSNKRKLYNHPKIFNSIEGLTPSNVFLYPNGPDFYIGELEVISNPMNCDFDNALTCTAFANGAPFTLYDCMPIINNQVQVRFEGLGNKVKVVYVPFKR